MRNFYLGVGINTYPGCPLSGCVNDVHDIAVMLNRDYAFKPSEIKLLTNARATTAGILKALESLVKAARAGDRVLFWYSGHGAQAPTLNRKEEPDGLDELMCPVDFDWSNDKMIRDKTLHSIFAKFKPGVIFNWGSDSCHSGDLDREMIFKPGHTLVSPGREIVRKAFPVPAEIHWQIKAAKEAGHSPRGMGCHVPKTGDALMNVGFLSGCLSSQTSADTSLNGRPCGAMTGYFLKTLPQTRAASLKAAAAAVCQALSADGYDQQPQAEGLRSDKPFLQ